MVSQFLKHTRFQIKTETNLRNKNVQPKKNVLIYHQTNLDEPKVCLAEINLSLRKLP